jgi:putative inorganic carbon (HCO3(-)) transporter
VLRSLFVGLIIVIGSVYSLRSTFYALLFYLWIAYFRPETWIWGDALANSGLSLYCGIYLIATLVLRGDVRSVRMGGALMLLFCLHSLLCTLLSPAFAYCWPFWLDFAKSTVISCVIVMLVSDYPKLRTVLLVICLSLGFEGAKQGLAQALLNPGESNTNPIAFLGDNNGVAVGMLMITPLLLALAQTSQKTWSRLGLRGIAAGTTLRAILTYSRGGLLALIAMLALFWLRSTRKVATLILILVIAGGALTLMPSKYWQRMGTLTTDEEAMDDSAAGRVYFWHVGVAMALANPLFGVGHNGYSRAFDRYDETGGRYGTRRAVHSTWFGTLADLGFPGLFLLVATYLFAWIRCSQARKRALKSGDVNLATLAGGLQAALVAFAVGGTFLSFQYVEILWHFFALSFATYHLTEARSSQPVPEAGAPAYAATYPATAVS